MTKQDMYNMSNMVSLWLPTYYISPNKIEIMGTFQYSYCKLLLVSCQIPLLVISSPSLDSNRCSLLALKSYIILDPYIIISSNWTNSSFVCSWIGITCNSHHNRVTTFNISNMGIKGTIPPQRGNLSFLVSLDLRYNLFNGALH